MTQRTKSSLSSTKNTSFADNTSGAITPAVLRTQQQDIIDSVLVLDNGATLQTVASEVDFDNLKFNSLHPFNSATVVLSAQSTSNQAPSATDTATQITFGAAQGTGADHVMIDSAGKITYNTTGIYWAATQFRIGRSGSTATAHLILAYKLNGAWVASLGGSILDNADNTFTISTAGFFSFTAGDYVEVFMIRDSSGQNDGGLYSFNPVLSGVPDIPSCRTNIYKMVSV